MDEQDIRPKIDHTDVFLEFALNCLLDQPANVVSYAERYFEDSMNSHTPITYDIRIDTIAIPGDVREEPDFQIPAGAEYALTRNRTVIGESVKPSLIISDDLDDMDYGKNEKQKEILKNVISKCLLFRSLDSDKLDNIIRVMTPVSVLPGDVVIKQFEEQDYFYVIEYGIFDVLMVDSPNKEPNHIFTYENEGNFGELALLYMIPMTSTVIARTDGRLWVINSKTFKQLVVKAAFDKRTLYETMIAKVPLLQELTFYERMVLADALVSIEYANDDIIFEKNDRTHGMYFVEKGTVIVYAKNKLGKYFELAKVEEGGYFGELDMLLKNYRTATAVAKGDVKLAFMETEAFERLLGPCKDVMKRNIVVYNSQMARIKNKSLYSSMSF